MISIIALFTALFLQGFCWGSKRFPILKALTNLFPIMVLLMDIATGSIADTLQKMQHMNPTLVLNIILGVILLALLDFLFGYCVGYKWFRKEG